MKRRAAKVGLIALEITAAIAATVGTAVAYLLWRLEEGDVSLRMFAQSVEFAIERRLPSHSRATVDDIVLSSSGDGKGYVLLVQGLTISGKNGVRQADIPQSEFYFSRIRMLRGRLNPTRIIIDGGEFAIVRGVDRKISVSLQGADEPTVAENRKPFIDRVLNMQLDRLALRNIDLSFVDAASGRKWTSSDASFLMERAGESIEADADFIFELDKKQATLALNAQYDDVKELVTVSGEAADVPLGDLLQIFYGEKAAMFDAPVSGEAHILLSRDGQIKSSSFKAVVEKGILRFGKQNAPISRIEVDADFEPSLDQFTVNTLLFDIDGSAGVFSGALTVDLAGNLRTPEKIVFDLEGQNISFDTKGYLPDVLGVSALAAQGEYFVAEHRIDIPTLSTSLAGVEVNGGLAVDWAEAPSAKAFVSPHIVADLKVDGHFDKGRLMSIWPVPAASGARDWIEARLIAANVDDVTFVMDMPEGAIKPDTGLPDDAMALSFHVYNGSAHYVEGMTPLTNASGRGVVRGNSFNLVASGGRIGKVALSKGEVSFPVFMPKWEPTYFRFSATGAAEDILSIINEEPLSLLAKVNLSPEQFTGSGSLEMEIMRPNKRDVRQDEYGYKGVAQFENVAVQEIFGSATLSDAAGSIDLSSRDMTVIGAANLGDTPVNFKWRETFFEADGPSQMEIDGALDSSIGDILGVPTRQFLRGDAKFTANVIGGMSAVQSLEASADFTDAALTLDFLGWRKPLGVKAAGEISVSFDETGINVHRITLDGEEIDVAGGFSLDANGAIQRADFNRLHLGDSIDLRASANRSSTGALATTFVGRRLNASQLIEGMMQGSQTGSAQSENDIAGGGVSASPRSPGFEMRARVDEVELRNGVLLFDTALDFQRNSDWLGVFEFSALGENRNPITFSLEHTGDDDGPHKTIDGRLDDIGGVLSGLFGVTSVRGGEGSLSLGIGEGGEISGLMEARNIAIINAPILAKILAAGSFDGLNDLMLDQGIAFDTASAAFTYRDGVLGIQDARGAGPSLGLTTYGEVSGGPGGAIKLSGAIVPAYGINSALGNTPVIGDMFVSRKGEGLLALSYNVSGATNNPTIFVNPLSALAPGFLRRIFEPEAFAPPDVDQLPAPESEPSVDIPVDQ